MRILHGENTVQSRNTLFQYISEAKTKNTQVTHLDAKTLTLSLLEQALGNTNLFAEPQLLIIEELHSLPKSKKKDELIEYIGHSASMDGIEVVLWEKRDLTATMLKKFPTARADQFKLSSTLFIWLDQLSGQKNPLQVKKNLELFHKALQNDGDFMCFSMLTRQIRLLIQAQENNFAAMAPFMIGKLKKQSATFTLDQLLALHHKLLIIDLNEKTSNSRLSLGQELELLLIGL